MKDIRTNLLNSTIIEEEIEKKFYNSELLDSLLDSYRRELPAIRYKKEPQYRRSLEMDTPKWRTSENKSRKNVGSLSTENTSGSAEYGNEVGPDAGCVDDNEDDGTEQDGTCLHENDKDLDSAISSPVSSEKVETPLKETEGIDGDDVSYRQTTRKISSFW